MGGGVEPTPHMMQVAMIHRLLLACLLCLGLEAQDSVVILLRHAEKTSRRMNAELSSAGRLRAERLPEELARFQPTALFASDLRRTQQTLEPLAKQIHRPIQIYDRGSELALGQSLLVRCAGATVVVCGHSDTLTDLVRGLGYPEVFPEVSGFDRYWVLRVPGTGGTVTLEEHRQRPLPPPNRAPVPGNKP